MAAGSPAIACTLTGKNRQDRIAWVSQLARDALRSQERGDLTLRLWYAPDAVDRVRTMVRDEQLCCAFLEFDLRQSPEGLLLTINAPEAARDIANELFAHFTAVVLE
jgi:hypothetical protein